MNLLSPLLLGTVRVLIGASPRFVGGRLPQNGPTIYFANHTSHIDTVALWAALPVRLRHRTRPVAARDYWGGSAWRRHVALGALNAVLIDREHGSVDPLAPLRAALDAGDSLILFPEGTRGREALPAKFRSGLFHLASAFPEVNLVPVYLENLHRSLPKGVIVPIPITCTVRFGRPMSRINDEPRDDFLTRARQAVVELA